METKSRVTQRKGQPQHNASPSENGLMEQPGEDQVNDESGSADQSVEEVIGTTDNAAPIGSSAELTEAEKHRPVCSPVSSTSKRRETMVITAENEPVIDASFANIGSIQDEREFWGAVTHAIGPLILNTIKTTGKRRPGGSMDQALIISGIKKPNLTLAKLLKLEGFSESAIQQLEAGQSESGANADQREFWGAIVGALVPVLKPIAVNIGGSLVKKGLKKLFESGQQESEAETEAMADQLEALFLAQLEADPQEAGADGADQREFWGALARRLAPVLGPIAKAAAAAAVKAGTALVSGGIKKANPTLAKLLRLEGFSESAIQQLESGQSEAGADGAAPDQREFWGAIASVLVPVLLPHAKKLLKAGASRVRKMLESDQQESGAEIDAMADQLEALFVAHAAAGPQESGADGADQREFWGALARKLVPALAPVAKAVAGAAVKAGTSWVKGLFESDQQESEAETEAIADQLEALFLAHAAAGPQESSANGAAADQREFWGALARRLAPVLAPVAKAVAGAAVKAGTALVSGGIKKPNLTLAKLLKLEGFSESAIQQLEAGQSESGANADQREFWGAIVGALVPVLKPIAVNIGGSLVKKGLKKLFESGQQESEAETEAMADQLEALFLAQLEADPQEAGADGADQREFWGALARRLAPVLGPIAKAAAAAAVKAGTALVSGGIKKANPTLAKLLRLEGFSESAIQQLESGQSEAGADGAAPDQREFWGAIASVLVPTLLPHAKKLAGAAIRSGGSLVRRVFESGQQEAGAETDALADQLEALFVAHAAAGPQESGANGADQREFWGALARKLAPGLSPIQSCFGGRMASTVFKRPNPTLAKLLKLEGFSESAIQQLEAGQPESGADADQREFWGAIARTLVPMLKPLARQFGGMAINAGGSLVKRIFESDQQESGAETMVASEELIQQLESLEVIIGTDERKRVTNTAAVPLKRICHLSITAADGSPFLGTGFFIGPRTIITAGHCVYDKDFGGWPQQIIVSPGRDGSNKPYGQFVATNFCSVEGWTENQDRDCDYGVIHLAKNANVSPEIGSFGFKIPSNQDLRKKRLTVAGYPGDKRGDEYGTMWSDSKVVKAVTPTTVVYEIDTVGGQSGSGVYDESNRVVAIHTNGSLDGNSATRITQPVFNNLKLWRSQGGAS